MRLRSALLFLIVCATRICGAQSLVPRAYLISPLHSNAITLTYSFNDGAILFDPAVPIKNSSGRLSVGSISLYHSLNFFGRSSNFAVSLPYTAGNFQGEVAGVETGTYRSGLLDSGFRFSVNLKGGPAMELKDFMSWSQKTIVGASILVSMPTGQYDPTKLINPGTNRWAFKPEIGLSQRFGHWIFDGYAGVWFFTTNPKFFSENEFSSGVNTRSQAPMMATEFHVSYDLKPGWWVSFDGNYWYGGRASLNGVLDTKSLQANSRMGGTGAIRISRHQSLKFSYSKGAIVRIGGNFQTVSFAWQYGWIGRPN